MDGCTALVKRMPLHLKKVHKLLLDSVEFKAALSRVRRLVSDSPRRRYHERRSNLGKDKGESSVSVEALEDNEDEIDVKILDDSESESEQMNIEVFTQELWRLKTVKMKMEAPLKLPTNCLKMSFLNLKPGLDQPTEVS